MSDPIVVVAGGDSPSGAFEAGLATAAAAQASEDADMAAAKADAAVAIAGAAGEQVDAAAGMAAGASLDAAAAHGRVDELEDFVREGFHRISDALVAEAVEHHLGETPDGGAAPEAHGDGSTATPAADKPPAKRTAPQKTARGGAFSNSWWFKRR